MLQCSSWQKAAAGFTACCRSQVQRGLRVSWGWSPPRTSPRQPGRGGDGIDHTTRLRTTLDIIRPHSNDFQSIGKKKNDQGSHSFAMLVGGTTVLRWVMSKSMATAYRVWQCLTVELQDHVLGCFIYPVLSNLWLVSPEHRQESICVFSYQHVTHTIIYQLFQECESA